MPPLDPDWNEEERELLDSATLDAPPSGSKARTLAALGIGGAAVGGAIVTGTAKAAELAAAQGSATSALAVGGGKSLVVAKWLMLVAVGGAAGGTALHYRAQSAAPAAPVVAPSAVPRAAVEQPELTQPEPAVRAPVPPQPTSSPVKVVPGTSEPDIALEIETLDRARRASERRDFTAALGELDRYDREFKQGRLRQEALLLRVQTLIGKGDSAAARTLGERFLSRYPKSPLAPRIQKLIGTAP
jgi:hypothetical protein